MTKQVLPHSKKIEEATIGTIIVYPESTFEDLESEDFYDPSLALIFDVVKNMKYEKRAIDLVTVYDEIKLKWYPITSLELWELATWVFTSTSLPSYKKSLKEYRRKREQVKLADELINLSDGEPATILEYSDRLRRVSMIWAKDDSSVKYDDVTEAYNMVTSRMGKALYGYSWWDNLSFLDEFTKWIIKKRVYRIGAPSNVGKTQFLYNVIANLLAQKNPDGKPLKIAFFTLENTREETLVSLMCNAKGINPDKLSKGQQEGDWDYLTELKDRLYIIDDEYEVGRIFSRCMHIKPDVVLLDYISLMDVKGSTEEAKYGEYARMVPRFAKSQDLAWIDLSNLPAQLQTNDEIRMRPQFYGSTILKNNCDVAIHIMSNEEFKKTKNSVFQNKHSYKPDDLTYLYNRNMVDLVVTKNRWWTPWVSTIYWANKENGWRWREMQKTDLDNLWAKFW